jgi:hypothetical protein
MVRSFLTSCAVLLSWVCAPAVVRAQDLEPRRWTHLPVGSTVLGGGYVFTTGDLKFDPVLRIDDAEVELHTAVVSFNRTFALFEQTARLEVHLPFQTGRWQGLLNGVPTTVHRDGLADPFVRLSTSLLGAPALEGKEFVAWRREHPVETTVGAALDVRVPLGEYKEDKLINLGQNRFAIGPQLGVLHTRGEWSFEATGTLLTFTDNDEFFNGNKLEQEPLLALQAHVVKTFPSGLWISTGVAYGWGGESSINDVRTGDSKSNLLYGGSVGMRITDTQSARIGYFRGDTLTEVGSDTHNFFVTWAIRF